MPAATQSAPSAAIGALHLSFIGVRLCEIGTSRRDVGSRAIQCIWRRIRRALGVRPRPLLNLHDRRLHDLVALVLAAEAKPGGYPVGCCHEVRAKRPDELFER